MEDIVLSNEMTCSDIFNNFDSVVCGSYVDISKPPIHDTYEDDLSISSHNIEINNK